MGVCQAQNRVTSTLLRQQLHLLQAEAFTEANIVDVSSYKELKAAVAERKWARGHWAGRSGQLVLLFSAQKFWINFWQSCPMKDQRFCSAYAFVSFLTLKY